VWRLDLPFGQASVVLGGVTAIGRNPSTVEGHPDATLVSVADPAKSVSKTHALVEPDSATVWVTDLASTNGVGAVASDDEISVLEPGVRTRVASGTRLMLGEFAITVVFG
jgi:predicted component of type VI protein secretion system